MDFPNNIKYILDAEKLKTQFREDIINAIKMGWLEQCISKLIAHGEADKKRVELCLECECGNLSSECGDIITL